MTFDPVSVRGSKYRINVGTAKKMKEKAGLDIFAKEEDMHPLGNALNTIKAIEAIAEPPIDLSDVAGEELIEIYQGFAEEFGRFFPVPEIVDMVKTILPVSPNTSQTPPSDA